MITTAVNVRPITPTWVEVASFKDDVVDGGGGASRSASIVVTLRSSSLIFSCASLRSFSRPVDFSSDLWARSSACLWQTIICVFVTLYSKTCVQDHLSYKDHLPLKTTCLERPLVYKHHLSINIICPFMTTLFWLQFYSFWPAIRTSCP